MGEMKWMPMLRQRSQPATLSGFIIGTDKVTNVSGIRKRAYICVWGHIMVMFRIPIESL